jgi:signal transduction histidine kinase
MPSNLVDNAIKYSPAGSQVSLRVFAAADRLGIAFGDTGPGIPEAEREAVLRRFYRLDKCRSTPASGLGLSLVAAVARLYASHLEIEDAHPGCRVTLWRSGVADQVRDADLQGSSAMAADERRSVLPTASA